ncbi:MAG TPA: 2,3-diaminopropionate biosynthesis protein SbnA [Micromonospora sp.]
MTIIDVPYGYNADDLFVDLRSIFDQPLYLKCEGFNFAASVKVKAAAEMVAAAERTGELGPGSIIVESSSGNLGVALSMIAASKGYKFVCVTDARCNHATRRLMEALGADVHMISTPDETGGFLGARLNYVRQLCASNPRYVWLNQYANPNNWRAHYQLTAPAIAREFPELDVLFVGAGTTGTLMGCARYFRQWHRRVTVVAVDAVGSVTFGAPPQRRMIPGLGTSVRPQLVDETWLDDIIHVSEEDTIAACHRMAARGFLFGGSTGTVVSGGLRWLGEHCADRPVTAVAIAPDMGERYLDSVYDKEWLAEHYPSVLKRPAVEGLPAPAGAAAVAVGGQPGGRDGVAPLGPEVVAGPVPVPVGSVSGDGARP